jgi:sugar phosphate isomerase/epimerase
MSHQFSRREFLALGGTTALAATLPKATFAIPMSDIPKTALQLYTVRNDIAKNMSGTFHKLASIGVKVVETAFWPEHVTLQQAAKALKNAGLSVCSSHTDIPIGDKKEGILKIAEAFNTKRVIWHGWPEDKRYSSLDGTKELIDIYNEAGEIAKSNGLKFGLHNHWWEYRNRVGGRFVYEWLLDGVDKDVFFEIDTYWVKVAGQDPAAIIKKFGSRVKYLHMKDGPAIFSQKLLEDKPDPMVALGRGAQNVPAIAKAARGNIEWMVIEMDVVATDVFQAIKDSYDYLLDHRFATN